MSSSEGLPAPSRSWTTAATWLPHFSSGTPATSASYTSGWTQGLLDLLRIDLLATGVDALGAAAEDGDDALLVDRRHVAEQHPPLVVLLEEGLGDLRVVVVAEGDMATLCDPGRAHRRRPARTWPDPRPAYGS